MNDAILSQNVLKCLMDNFGVVQTERFISILIKEPFDYTKWQRDLYSDMSVEELFEAASDWKNITFSKEVIL
jgi:hypothetical protein